jgi:hypothetical protein
VRAHAVGAHGPGAADGEPATQAFSAIACACGSASCRGFLPDLRQLLAR